MNRSFQHTAMLLMLTLAFVGCEAEPGTFEQKEALHSEAQAAIQQMTARDPGLQQLINDAHGYAIFPAVGKGGFIVGGGYGRGEVYEQGRLVGYADITQLEAGLLAGGQEFSELILFQTPQALNQLKGGEFTVGGNISAIALKTGASATARFQEGVMIFTMPRGGLMASISVSGQRFTYTPLDQAQIQPAAEVQPGPIQ